MTLELPMWAQILLEDKDSKTKQAQEVAESARRNQEKTCLMLLAHGSRDPKWQEPFEKIFASMQRELGSEIRLAYMELAQPSLTAVVEQCAKEGVRSIRVLPMFMAVGAHLANDVPEELKTLREKFPELSIELLRPVGEDPRMRLLIQEIIREQFQ